MNRDKKDIKNVARTTGLTESPALVGYSVKSGEGGVSPPILIIVPVTPKKDVASWMMNGVSSADWNLVRNRYLHPGPNDLIPVSRAEEES